MSDLRYPIGRPPLQDVLTPEQRREKIAAIASTPVNLRRAIDGLTDVQLDTPYRPDGWTVRQVVHHVPDSHINAYTRFRLALTEDHPTIRPYDEKGWAMLSDARTAPLELSLLLLDALHARWIELLNDLSPEDFGRALRHPSSGDMTVDTLLCMYAWHGPHHIAHITALREREGWV